MEKDDKDRIISRLETSLFEAGSQLSKSVVWMMVISSTLFLLTHGTDPNKLVKIPAIGLELTRVTSVAVVLVMYAFSYLRYIVLTNHQKYIFWELAEVGGYYQRKSYPWQSLNPTAINAILFHGYRRPKSVKPYNIQFLAIMAIIFAAAPIPAIIYLTGEFSGQPILMVCFIFSLYIYGYAGKHYFEYMRNDNKQREDVAHYFNQQPNK